MGRCSCNGIAEQASCSSEAWCDWLAAANEAGRRTRRLTQRTCSFTEEMLTQCPTAGVFPKPTCAAVTPLNNGTATPASATEELPTKKIVIIAGGAGVAIICICAC